MATFLSKDDPYVQWAIKWRSLYPAPASDPTVAKRRRDLAIAELDAIAQREGRRLRWWSKWVRRHRQVQLLTSDGCPRHA